MQNEFIIYMSDALRAKAKTLGVSLVESDGQGKAENQVSAVENFIAQKVDAIVLNPYDKEGCAPAVEKAVAAHIPIDHGQHPHTGDGDVGGIGGDVKEVLPREKGRCHHHHQRTDDGKEGDRSTGSTGCPTWPGCRLLRSKSPELHRSIIALWVLRRMTAGLTLFAIGNNETASRMAGLSVERAKTLVYTACGGLSALAGLVFAARVSSAKADFGVGLELDAITVVVLSGASLAGGSANVPGLVLGLLTIGVIRMGLSMLFVPSEIQAILINPAFFAR